MLSQRLQNQAAMASNETCSYTSIFTNPFCSTGNTILFVCLLLLGICLYIILIRSFYLETRTNLRQSRATVWPIHPSQPPPTSAPSLNTSNSTTTYNSIDNSSIDTERRATRTTQRWVHAQNNDEFSPNSNLTTPLLPRESDSSLILSTSYDPRPYMTFVPPPHQRRRGRSPTPRTPPANSEHGDQVPNAESGEPKAGVEDGGLQGANSRQHSSSSERIFMMDDEV